MTTFIREIMTYKTQMLEERKGKFLLESSSEEFIPILSL